VDIRVPRPNIRTNPRAIYKIGEHVKRKRLELGMDQEDVATLLGIDIHMENIMKLTHLLSSKLPQA
jgi:hypothetical protein